MPLRTGDVFSATVLAVSMSSSVLSERSDGCPWRYDEMICVEQAIFGKKVKTTLAVAWMFVLVGCRSPARHWSLGKERFIGGD